MRVWRMGATAVLGPKYARILAPICALALVVTTLACRPVQAAEPGFLGLEIQGLDERAVAALGADYAKGVLVKDVAVGEPGAIAGFRRGDFIVEFDGSKVGTFEDMLKLVGKTKPDEKISVVVLRGGKKTDLTLRTTARPATWNITTAVFNAYPELGVTVVSITDEVRQKFGLPWGTIGVVVSEVDANGPLASSLKPGEVIVSANLRDVWEPRHLTRQLEDARRDGRQTIMLLVRSTAGYRYSLLPVK